MKILVFYPYIPYPVDRGTYQRTFHLLKALASRNEVHLLALAEHGQGCEHREVFEQFCAEVELIPFEHPAWQKLFPERLLNPLPSNVAHWSLPHVASTIEARLRRVRYDFVHICDIVLAQYFVDRHQETPVTVDRSRVDLQFQWMEHRRMNFSWKTQLLRLESYAKLWRYERKVAARARAEVVCGPDDKDFLRRYVSRTARIEVIANGVNLQYFQRDDSVSRAEAPTILFCGALDYNPNIDALRWYFQTIHERLKARVPSLEVLIIGKSPTPEIVALRSLPGVRVIGDVPDVRPHYRKAWLQIVPLRIGGGTRLKIVESMAIGTPVLSTTIGAQGLNLRHREDILVADDATEFAEVAAEALLDEALRSRISDKAETTARARLSWEKLGGDLCDAYDRLFSANVNGLPRNEGPRATPKEFAPAPAQLLQS